jgi:RHS repeat-associated protein
VLQRSEYEPYGQLTNRALTDGPGYTGHVQDAATGLTYMQQRYYDPLIGRFLSVDPVTAYSSPGANFNRYWYANNSPYRFTDPDGRIGRDDPPKDILKTVANKIQEVVNTPAPQNWPLSGDVFTTAEVDATFIAGPEVSAGQVLDLDDPLASGLYFSYATGQGANVGTALGLGYVTGDIEGKGATLDINAGKVSPTVMLDDKGNFHGAALSVGPGAGVSGSVGKTWTLSVRDVLNMVKSIIEK